jgi:hypothetical protein
VYLYWAPEDSSRSTGDEQDPCLETRKIHIFDYNLSPVGGEEVKCIVRRKGFLTWISLKVGGGPWTRQPTGNSVGHSTFKMRPKTELPHMLSIRIYIYISKERNRQTEMLAQRAVRLNGIGADLPTKTMRWPILVNQSLRTS